MDGRTRGNPAASSSVSMTMRVVLDGHRAGAVAVALGLVVAVGLAACAPVPARPGAPLIRGSAPPRTSRRASAGGSGATSTAATSFAAAGCPGNSGEIVQSMAGRISSCLRVREVAGDYHVTLEQVLATKGTLEQVKGRGAGSPATAVPARPVVHLALSPAAGAPGTAVTVTGTLSAPLPHPPGHANFCWDGCRDGLSYAGVALRWTSSASFQARIVLPAAPWIEAAPDRVLEPRPGTYPVGVACLPQVKGCGLGGAQGTALFHLSGPASGPRWCASVPTCAELTVSPRTAAPGDVVRVAGFAPLVSIIGSDTPFDFQFEVRRGRGAGAQVQITRDAATGVVLARFGHAALAVAAPPSFASLPATAPLAETTDSLPAVAADPTDPAVLAWCTPHGVEVAGPGGERSVPTTAATAAVVRLGFAALTPPACVAAVGLGHPAGASAGGTAGAPPVLAAAFEVAPPDQNPMVALVALVTTDGGASWQPVGVPPGARPDGFGGFRESRRRLEALFARSAASGAFSYQAAPVVEVASSAGTRWRPGRFACPASGPCVTFGAFVPGNCAMNGSTQTILYSTDAGLRWSLASWPASVQACLPATLVALSGNRELLVDAGSLYTVRESTDGGATWRVLGLPAIPGVGGRGAFSPGSGVLVVLPDGSLLAGTAGGDPTATSWELLRPHARRWCPATAAFPATREALFGNAGPVVIGPDLWWRSAGPAGTAVYHVPVASIRC